MTQKYNFIIKNIHTNNRFPGNIYAELWCDDQLILGALLENCVERLREYIKHAPAEQTPVKSKKDWNRTAVRFEWIREDLTAVYLENKRVGKITRNLQGKFRYYPNSAPNMPGPVYDTLEKCQQSLLQEN